MKWILLIVGVVVFFAVGGSAVLAKVPEVRDRVGELVGEGKAGAGSAAAQISSTEFVQVRRGASTRSVRALVGAPETTHTAKVEGLEVECWYYGIVGATGTYQLCFVDGKRTARARFARS